MLQEVVMDKKGVNQFIMQSVSLGFSSSALRSQHFDNSDLNHDLYLKQRRRLQTNHVAIFKLA